MRQFFVAFQILVALIAGVSGVCFLGAALYEQDRQLMITAAWTLLVCCVALLSQARTIARWFHP